MIHIKFGDKFQVLRRLCR